MHSSFGSCLTDYCRYGIKADVLVSGHTFWLMQDNRSIREMQKSNICSKYTPINVFIVWGIPLLFVY